jgi:ELWxxDGT repeat protein
MKTPLLTFLLAGISFLAGGQQFALLKDINPGAPSSNICYLTNVSNTLFFAANNGVNGMELWKTDGTEAGTQLVKDINPGSFSSSIGYLIGVHNTLFFVANNGTNGTELWKSDGTTAGTVMVKDIRAGNLGSNPSALADVNGTLFFAADDGVKGVELWKSDGTTAGTVMVKDIAPFSGCSYPQSLADVNGTLFFSATDGVKGMELWKSDGTVAGTVMVQDIWTGINGGYPADLTNVNGTLFFAASNGVKGTELWKSDGTAAGTVLVKDIWNGAGDSYPFYLKNINGILYFSADNGSAGSELWKSDGTTAGTALVRDVWPGPESGTVGNFSKVINKLVFTGNDGVNGYKTWESDGSFHGTKIADGFADPGEGDMQELVETANNIFASIRLTSIGRELYAINYSSILPLEFLEFKGRLEKTDGILNWKTENEINTAEFVVERSIDGINYVPAGKVNAANAPGIQNYSFTDNNIVSLGADIIYYRLHQKDITGRSSYSKVITLAIPATSRIDVDLYPNPAVNTINLIISTPRKEKMDYRVFDSKGRIVMRATEQTLAGTNKVALDVNRLPAGVYYISLNSASVNKSLQFIKH